MSQYYEYFLGSTNSPLSQFFSKYAFQVVLNPFIDAYHFPSCQSYIASNANMLQSLTIEIDFTRFAFSKEPAAVVLRADTTKTEKCIRVLVDGLKKRQATMPFIHLMCRRWYGNRPDRDANEDLVAYVPVEHFLIIERE